MAKSHIPPETVFSPRRYWTLIKVLENQGEERHALALGRWDGKARLAMRWNGSRENPIGNPQSRGLPTWFILPEEYEEAVLSTLPPDEVTLARNFLQNPK